MSTDRRKVQAVNKQNSNQQIFGPIGIFGRICRAAGFCSMATMLLFLGLTGCVTSGKYFASDTAWIKNNQTRQEDVKSLLGQPFMVGNSGGSPTWTYGYYRYKLVGESFTKELKFYWNPDRTVQSFSFNSSFPEDISGASDDRKPSRTGGSNRPVSSPGSGDGFHEKVRSVGDVSR